MSTSVSACVDLLRRSPSKFRGEWVSAGDIHIGEGVSRRSAAAFGVRMLRVVSGLVGWKGVQKHACRAIADSRSWWKLGREWVYQPDGRAGSAAAQSRAGAQRGNALGREWVICRKGTLERCAIASLHSAWKRTGSRAGLSAGRALVHMPGNRALFVEMLWVASGFIGRTCTPQRAAQSRSSRSPLKYRASSVCNSGYPRSGLADQPRGHPHR